jgi:hypothetical protein
MAVNAVAIIVDNIFTLLQTDDFEEGLDNPPSPWWASSTYICVRDPGAMPCSLALHKSWRE